LALILGFLAPAGWQASGCHPGHRVVEADGAWGEKTRYGKKSLGIIHGHF